MIGTAGSGDNPSLVTPLQLLDSMYGNEPQLGSDGQLHTMDPATRIPRDEGALLVQLHATLKAQCTVEIGLGYGFSTVFFLMAMQESGRGGHHIAIDPAQYEYYHGIGARRAQLLRMQDRFTLIEDESAVALPRLAAEGLQAHLILVDGQHRFDNVLVDFFLADAICAPNGAIVFDDVWLPSIRKVVRFIRNNRSDYHYAATDVQTAAVFHKVGRDERPWNHYVDF